jgi:para-nitrobenzyl esterase
VDGAGDAAGAIHGYVADGFSGFRARASFRRRMDPMLRSSRVVLAAALLLAGATPGRTQTGPRVKIDAGVLEGTVSPSGVRMFRGIPFAAPPVGELRWQPPRPVPAWQGVRSAVAFGPRCMQLPIFSDMVFRSNGMGEDCLYLNVWTPAQKAGEGRERLPVLVYFYGGGNVAGDGSELRYDGESLAGKGIVVLTVNYRLGVFGFLAHPELTRESPHHASGDYGLLDQAAALAWVRRNIAAFGGDPHRVTIAGESAGSIAVNAQMASPLSRGLIAGAIGESGAMIYPTFAPVPLAQGEQDGLSFAGALGATSLAQLRALPADSLLRATGGPGRGRFPVTLDGWFLPRSPEQIFAAGEQAHVPLLVGWNSEESSWHGLLGTQEPTPENYAAAVRKLFGTNADEALRLFPGGTAEQVLESATALAGARFIAYSTWKWAELQSRTGGRPVYRYLYAQPRPPTRAPSPNPPPRGAVHSAEIEYALGNLGTNQVFTWTPEDYKLSAVMEAYFANFVRTGNPDGPGLPPWPASNSGDSVRVMMLDTNPRAEPLRHGEGYRFLDRVYSAEERR